MFAAWTMRHSPGGGRQAAAGHHQLSAAPALPLLVRVAGGALLQPRHHLLLLALRAHLLPPPGLAAGEGLDQGGGAETRGIVHELLADELEGLAGARRGSGAAWQQRQPGRVTAHHPEADLRSHPEPKLKVPAWVFCTSWRADFACPGDAPHPGPPGPSWRRASTGRAPGPHRASGPRRSGPARRWRAVPASSR